MSSVTTLSVMSVTGGHHDPHGAGDRQCGDELGERRRARGSFAGQLGDGRRLRVVDHRGVPVGHRTSDEVRAHATKTDHADRHAGTSSALLPVNS